MNMYTYPQQIVQGDVNMINSSLQPEIIETNICPRGQFFILTFRASGTIHTAANIYGDPDTDQSALETMTRIYNILNDIKTQFNPRIILGGDSTQHWKTEILQIHNQSQEQTIANNNTHGLV